jgi:hypothetical protein
LRFIDRPTRHLRGAVRNCCGGTQIIRITDGRVAVTQGRDLERKVSAAHAGAFDRVHAHNIGANFDGARFHAGYFGIVAPWRALAGHKAARAAGKRQQHACARETEGHAAFHARKNASSSFNEASTLHAGDFVKDKKSLPIEPTPL